MLPPGLGRRQRLVGAQPDGPPVDLRLGADARVRSAPSAGRSRRRGSTTLRGGRVPRRARGVPRRHRQRRLARARRRARHRRSPRRSTIAASHGAALRGTSPRTLPRQVRFSLNVEQLPSRHNRVTIDRALRRRARQPAAGDRATRSTTTRSRGMAAAKRLLQRGLRARRDRGRTTPAERHGFPSVALRRRRAPYHGIGPLRGHALHGRRPGDLRGRCRPALLGAPQPLPGRRRQLARRWATSNPTLTLAALTLRARPTRLRQGAGRR